MEIFGKDWEHGKWNDNKCDAELGFICKSSQVQTTTDQSVTTSAVPASNVIIVTGGYGNDMKSVEALKEDGTSLCTLADLPDNRH